jgi:DNA-binding transcriptional ArsR family regulator
MAAYYADVDRCDCTSIHEETVDAVRKEMLDDDVLMDLADTFKLFSDSTRMKILNALLHEELCVCDLAVLLGMTKSSVSHQLRILKQSDLVRYGKDGRVVYYSLADDHVRTIFDQGLAHVMEEYDERN